MSRRAIIRAAAFGALVGLAVGSGGILAQMILISTGATESPALIAACGTLTGISLTTLGGLAALVWTKNGDDEG